MLHQYFMQVKFKGVNPLPAHGRVGARATSTLAAHFTLQNTHSKPAEKRAVQSEGEAEGGCGGNSASPEPKRSPAALLVQSRGQQKSFLFLLEEKIGRAQNKKCEENFFAGQRAKRAAAGRSVQNSVFGFSSKNVRTSSKKHRQLSHFEKTRLVASRLRRSALNFAGIFQAFFKSKESVRSAMRKFAERSSGKMKFCKPIFFLSSASGRTKC